MGGPKRDMRKKIFISIMIQRNLKYLLNTEFYGMLRKNFDLVLLVGFPYKQEFEKIYGGENVTIISLDSSRGQSEPGTLQKAFMKYLLFHLDFKLTGEKIGRVNLLTKKKLFPRQYKICKLLYWFSPLFMTGPVFKRLARRLFHDQKIEDIVAAHRPDLVISTTPAKLFTEYCLQRSAKTQGIPLVFYPASWDDFTRSGIFPFAPDKILSWGPEMSRHAIEFLGMPTAVTANAGLVRMEASLKAEESSYALHRHFDIPEDHKVILFATNKPEIGVALPRIIEELLEDMEAGKLGKAILLLRPNNTRPDNQRIYIERFRDHPLVRLNLPENDGEEAWEGRASLEWRQIISGADVIVSVCSMMILEALYLGTPVVNPNYNYGMLNQHGFDYTFYYNREVFKKIKELGGTTMADDRQSLARAIKDYLDDPNLHQERREVVMEQWDVRPTPPRTRGMVAVRELEALLG